MMLRPKSVRVVCAFAQSEVARNSVPKRCGVNLASFQGKQNVEHVECRKERSHMVYADSETDNNREKKCARTGASESNSLAPLLNDWVFKLAVADLLPNIFPCSAKEHIAAKPTTQDNL